MRAFQHYPREVVQAYWNEANADAYDPDIHGALEPPSAAEPQVSNCKRGPGHAPTSAARAAEEAALAMEDGEPGDLMDERSRAD